VQAPPGAVGRSISIAIAHWQAADNCQLRTAAEWLLLDIGVERLWTALRYWTAARRGRR
jgi:hypothetical protein